MFRTHEKTIGKKNEEKIYFVKITAKRFINVQKKDSTNDPYYLILYREKLLRINLNKRNCGDNFK